MRVNSGLKIGHVVIGANYGDEGKGLMTDYLSCLDAENTTVVRFNGGAQAGHTVVAPDGRRHVFSHFGSGSFVDCPTNLSRYFIVNPLLFARELEALRRLGLLPSVTIDPRAIVTTPVDMFINQIIEMRRGTNRHGSCGLGINETVVRCTQEASMQTCVADLLEPARLISKLEHLEHKWLPERLRSLGITAAAPDIADFIGRQGAIMEAYLEDCVQLLNNAAISAEPPNCKTVVFEGAQGLMLDEDRLDQWPHVTRSKTGLFNVVRLAEEWNLRELHVAYMTRTYLTRHGAGPLPGEKSLSFRDDTNVPNQFQGHLRFAPLNVRQLTESIFYDLSAARHTFKEIKPYIAMTCADQAPPPPLASMPLSVRFVSHGPTRNAVEPARQLQVS